MKKKIHSILKKYWGYDSFRPLQEDIILSLLDGKDTLALLPTGGGKSITFQVPGLVYEDGLTIIISPLISLMKDQVDNLKRQKIKAVYFFSNMTTTEWRIAWEHLTKGKAKFLYITPERLQNPNFINELRNLKIRFIIVDEAHCISQWGYEFRPSYLKISELRKIIPEVPVLALTATARPDVANDIMRQLRFKKDNIIRKSFIRDNINFIVRESNVKISQLLNILLKTSGCSIVYTRSRKGTKRLAEFLLNNDISATYYHAGLSSEEKKENQDKWKNDHVRVMVATNAFGMGIDKPDVRIVIHYDIPSSPEEYFQEAGRAGRDGKNSYAVLLVSPTDKAVLSRRLTSAFPPRADIKDIYNRICIYLKYDIGDGYDRVKEFDLSDFCRTYSLQENKVKASIRLLENSGYLHFIEEGDQRSRVQFRCDREELYSLGNISEKTEKVMQTILRLYPGIFTEFKFINEGDIASFAGVGKQTVYEGLIELSRKKIISFIPRSGVPLIHMMTAREEAEYVVIPKRVYEIRKEILSSRIEMMKDYSFNSNDCRVVRLLNYFGENSVCHCGKCDVCRDNNKTFTNKETDITQKLSRLVNSLKQAGDAGISFNILAQNHNIEKKELIQLLNYLCNEGWVRLDEEVYRLNK